MTQLDDDPKTSVASPERCIEKISLQGKVALLTGASGGIGLAAAQLFARRGAKLVLNARDPDRLNSVCESLLNEGSDVSAVVADVTDPSTPSLLVQEAFKKYGHIDILVNNAGGSTHGRLFSAIDAGVWADTLARNLSSCVMTAAAVVPLMQARGSGAIINVSSAAGRKASVMAGTDYASAKSGLIGFTRQLAYELGEHGIRVNAVAPGITVTPRVLARWEALDQQSRRERLSSIPMRRLGLPWEVAEAIAFLASDAASYITGTTLDVNGGYYMS